VALVGALLAWWAPLRPLRAGRRPAGLVGALATLAGWPSPCWPGSRPCDPCGLAVALLAWLTPLRPLRAGRRPAGLVGALLAWLTPSRAPLHVNLQLSVFS